MSIQGLPPVPRSYSPATTVPVARAPQAPAAPAPRAAGAASPQPGFFSGLLDKVQHAATGLKDWIFTPFRKLAGNYGADLFVRPGQGTSEGPAPSHWGLKYETLNFQAKDGTPLKGWYMPAAQPTGKTIVLAHGHAGNQSDSLWRWAPWLHKAGYNLVSFDFRNHGGSGGDKTTMGFEERQDLDAAITQAQAKGGSEIAVIGLSMGGATALSQAANDPRIKAVVADCSFDTVENAVASRVAKNTFDIPGFAWGPFKWEGLKGLHFPFQKQVTRGVVEASEQLAGLPEGALSAADPLRAMSKLKDRPVFLLHGEKDDDTLPSNSVNLAKANPNADLWIVPGAAHSEAYPKAKTEYQTRVLDFLKQNF